MARTLGLVGGLGPETTIDYYRRILGAWSRLEPGVSPRIVMDSLDVQTGLRLVANDRAALVDYLDDSVQRLARAGCAVVAMAANTAHIVFDEVAARSPVPLVSIVEATAREAQRRGLRNALLLGTRFTMEAPFYPDVCARYGVTLVSPDEADRLRVHDVYVNQLLQGSFTDPARGEITALITRLRDAHGVDGVILGGTELVLLLRSDEVAGIPALDTAGIHVDAIVAAMHM